jgi:hypothetical protein
VIPPRRRKTAQALLVSCLLIPAAPGGEAEAAAGYGYRKAEDPLVLAVKRIILRARRGDWDSVSSEFQRLDWQFAELKKDLDVDIAGRFEKAIGKESLAALSPEICRVMYFAVVQKLHWNRVEECKKYVRAKSRTEAALFYYEEILAIGTRDYDEKNGTDLHGSTLKDFEILRQSIGTAGLFGIGSRPPDMQAFEEGAERILERLRQVYPYLSATADPRSKGGGAGAKS